MTIFFANGTGKNRSCLLIDKMKIGEQEKEAQIGFQAITGYDCHSLEKENANAGKK